MVFYYRNSLYFTCSNICGYLSPCPSKNIDQFLEIFKEQKDKIWPFQKVMQNESINFLRSLYIYIGSRSCKMFNMTPGLDPRSPFLFCWPKVLGPTIFGSDNLKLYCREPKIVGPTVLSQQLGKRWTGCTWAPIKINEFIFHFFLEKNVTPSPNHFWRYNNKLEVMRMDWN